MSFNPNDFSLRPIISSIGTYNCNLAKFLTELLDPVIPLESCAKDLFSFSEEIQPMPKCDFNKVASTLFSFSEEIQPMPKCDFNKAASTGKR